jgi:hypothetical protein
MYFWDLGTEKASGKPSCINMFCQECKFVGGLIDLARQKEQEKKIKEPG